MPVETLLLLVAAGVGAGLAGYLTGLASLVSYPALLAAGLPPVAANVTNTVALIGIGAGATAKASRVVLAGERRALARDLTIAALGGVVGAVLLLGAGDDTFAAVVPWLIALASLAVLLQPRLRRLVGGRPRPGVYAVLLALVCVYGGYFGAGAGTLYLAVTLVATSETFARAMVLKSVLLMVSNVVAAVLFVLAGPVVWPAALAMGAGCLLGGWLGPVVQGWLPETLLRRVVAVAGLGLAAWLLVSS